MLGAFPAIQQPDLPLIEFQGLASDIALAGRGAGAGAEEGQTHGGIPYPVGDKGIRVPSAGSRMPGNALTTPSVSAIPYTSRRRTDSRRPCLVHEGIRQVESELDRLRKKVENFPSASMFNRIAELSRQAGDKDAAEQACKRCIKEFPRSSQAYVILADLKVAEGKSGEARQLVITAIEKDPRSYAAHWLSATLAESKEKAIHHLRLILAFKPGDIQASQRIQELGGVAPTGGASATVSNARFTPRPGAEAITTTAKELQAAIDVPIAMPGAAATPVAEVSINTAIRQTLVSRTGILDTLCAEPGVRGAVISDDRGRVVSARGLAAGQDELLAAMAEDLGKTALEVLRPSGVEGLTSWSMAATLGQIISFHRGEMTVVVVAEAGVRPAMLELRARQALVDLGGA